MEPLFCWQRTSGMQLAPPTPLLGDRIEKDTPMMLMTYTVPMTAMLIGLATYWVVTKLW